MKRAGLWLDRRMAVVVILIDEDEQMVAVAWYVQEHIRFTGGTASEVGSTQDMCDRELGNRRDRPPRQCRLPASGRRVLPDLRPAEAKDEFRKRLEQEGLKSRVAAIEIADKMADRQSAAKVREHGVTRRQPQGSRQHVPVEWMDVRSGGKHAG